MFEEAKLAAEQRAAELEARRKQGLADQAVQRQARQPSPAGSAGRSEASGNSERTWPDVRRLSLFHRFACRRSSTVAQAVLLAYLARARPAT